MDIGIKSIATGLTAGYPEKQGLKLHSFRYMDAISITLTAGYPEKQGLKQKVDKEGNVVDLLTAGYPEKQGLKPFLTSIGSKNHFLSRRVIQKNKD